MPTRRIAAISAVLAFAFACGGEIEPRSTAGGLAAEDPASSSSSGDASTISDGGSDSSDASAPPPWKGGEPTPPPFDWPASCPSAPTTAFVNAPISVFADAQNAMPGRWRGTQSNPWSAGIDPSFPDPIEVAFVFEANGHYATRRLSGPDWARVLYYGTELDTPLKQYRLEDLVANGTVTGEIDVAFWYEPDQFGVAGWQGLIDDLAFDVTRNRMRFEMRTSDGYGPIVLELWRCP